jgi:hypothetical protein
MIVRTYFHYHNYHLTIMIVVRPARSYYHHYHTPLGVIVMIVTGFSLLGERKEGNLPGAALVFESGFVNSSIVTQGRKVSHVHGL